MATIWKTSGAFGEGSTDAGTEMPLEFIDERLCKFQVAHRGVNPPSISPRTQYYTYIIVEVSGACDHPRPERFAEPGFYLVAGLHVDDAQFLFEPYTFAPFDARAKAQVAHLPVDAFVTRDSRDPAADYMTVEVRFKDQPDRNNIKHSKVVQSAADNEEFVDRVVGEFLTMNGIERPGLSEP